MQTKEYLMQIRKFERMIKNKLLEIEELETNACNIVAPTDTERVKSSGNSDKIGLIGGMVADIEARIEFIKDERNAIINQIDELEEVDYYDILTKYYVLGMDLIDIADSRNCGVDNIKRLKRNAMNSFEAKYGAKYLNLH